MGSKDARGSRHGRPFLGRALSLFFAAGIGGLLSLFASAALLDEQSRFHMCSPAGQSFWRDLVYEYAPAPRDDPFGWVDLDVGHGAGASAADSHQTAAVQPAEPELAAALTGTAGGGRWVKDESFCLMAYPGNLTCTPDTHFRYLDPEIEPFWYGDHACELLREANMTDIMFVGDSFTKGIFQALILLLSEDFETGSVTPDAPAVCVGDTQFDGPQCRNYLAAGVQICGLTLMLDYEPYPRLNASHLDYDAVVWGVGVHPINGDRQARYGVLDADKFANEVLESLCDPDSGEWAEGKDHPPVFWSGIHMRIDPHHPDEAREHQEEFARQSAEYVKSMCGFHPIDNFEFTRQLVDEFSDLEVWKMSYDGVHWARAVNLIKAQKLLRALVGYSFTKS